MVADRPIVDLSSQTSISRQSALRFRKRPGAPIYQRLDNHHHHSKLHRRTPRPLWLRHRHSASSFAYEVTDISSLSPPAPATAHRPAACRCSPGGRTPSTTVTMTGDDDYANLFPSFPPGQQRRRRWQQETVMNITTCLPFSLKQQQLQKHKQEPLDRGIHVTVHPARKT